MILFFPRHFINLYSTTLNERTIVINRRQIEEIISSVLNICSHELYLQKCIKISLQKYCKIFSMFNRRRWGEPLQHILGFVQFRNLVLRTPRGVFIPRIETEQLVDITLKYISHDTKNIIDVGTGTGAIAISLIKEKPNNYNYDVLGVDLSNFAVDISINNAKKNNIENIKFIKSDLLNEIIDDFADIIVANLPYISKKSYDHLSHIVKHFDPKLALYGGRDGLTYIKKLILQSYYKLKKIGYLILEIGYGQLNSLLNFITNNMCNKFEILNVINDYNNISRFVVLCKH